MIVPACAWPRSSANNVKPNVFCDCLCLMNIFMPWKFATGIFGSLILVQGHVWDFCPHFSDHPCHLARIPPSPPGWASARLSDQWSSLCSTAILVLHTK